MLNEFAYRKGRTAQLGLRMYVALTWLTQGRDSIAGSWDRGPRPSAIAADPSLANAAVRHAMKYWCAWAATTYEPDAFSPGIQINFYARQRPSDWPNLVSLYREVYDTLKTLRPGMQVSPTWQLDEMWKYGHWSLVPAFEDKMDALALALYPGGYPGAGGSYTPDNLPADYIGHARTATGTTKPLVVSETGYGDSALASLGTPGSPELQRDYVAWLIRQADSLGVAQVTWFFPTDPWGILDAMPPEQRGAFAFFGPMGMRKRTLAAKSALGVWDAAVARPYWRP